MCCGFHFTAVPFRVNLIQLKIVLVGEKQMQSRPLKSPQGSGSDLTNEYKKGKKSSFTKNAIKSRRFPTSLHVRPSN